MPGRGRAAVGMGSPGLGSPPGVFWGRPAGWRLPPGAPRAPSLVPLSRPSLLSLPQTRLQTGIPVLSRALHLAQGRSRPRWDTQGRGPGGNGALGDGFWLWRWRLLSPAAEPCTFV